MIKLAANWSFLPVEHGSWEYCQILKQSVEIINPKHLCVEFPQTLATAFENMVFNLPKLQLLPLKDLEGKEYYLSNDPCDVLVQTVKTASQKRLQLHWTRNFGKLHPREQMCFLDPLVLLKMGVEARKDFFSVEAEGLDLSPLPGDFEAFMEQVEIVKTGEQVLSLGSLRTGILFKYWLQNSPQIAKSSSQALVLEEPYSIHPNSAFFALGELPSFAGRIEGIERDLFAKVPTREDLIKELAIEVGRNFMEKREALQKISLVKLQKMLDFIGKWTRSQGKLIPDLRDMVVAARGVFGDSFALALLRAAKNYPYFDFIEQEAWVQVVPSGYRHPTLGDVAAVNLLRDPTTKWEELRLRREPKLADQEKYRKNWNFNSMCSHLPEDIRIETFNKNARALALAKQQRGQNTAQKFAGSFLDGIDLRETLRHWHNKELWVRESPRQRVRAETVVLVFDRNQDLKYPLQMVWYAEHKNESTLSFYATEPMEKLKGPGIAEAQYGGLSLLFPPRPVPNPFKEQKATQYFNLAEKLVWGALLTTREKAVVYCAAEPPSEKMREMAVYFQKELQWISFHSFSEETLHRLRNFHVLGGKEVRSWANRFID